MAHYGKVDDLAALAPPCHRLSTLYPCHSLTAPVTPPYRPLTVPSPPLPPACRPLTTPSPSPLRPNQVYDLTAFPTPTLPLPLTPNTNPTPNQVTIIAILCSSLMLSVEKASCLPPLPPYPLPPSYTATRTLRC